MAVPDDTQTQADGPTSGFRSLTQAELMAEATARFGQDYLAWAFTCPACGDTATFQDFKDAGATADRVGQECIGRTLGALTKPEPTHTRGCDWAAYGLFRGPWKVTLPAADGKPEREMWCFPLADPPDPARDVPRDGSPSR